MKHVRTPAALLFLAACAAATVADAQVKITPMLVAGDPVDREHHELDFANGPGVTVDGGPQLVLGRTSNQRTGQSARTLLRLDGLHHSTIFLSFDQAPGFPAGVHFDPNRWPGHYLQSRNGAGLFRHHLKGTLIGSHNDETLWRIQGQSLALVMQEGAHAPGFAPDVTIDRLADTDRADISADGEIIFDARLEGPGIDATNRWSLWLASPDRTPELLMWQGSSGDTPRGTRQSVWSINAAGEILLAGQLDHLPGADGATHVWRGRPGSFQRWFGVGDTIVDSRGTTTLKSIGIDARTPIWHGDQLLFLGGVHDDTGPSSLMRAHGQGIDVLVEDRAPAPGFADATLSNIEPIAQTPAGDIYFGARVRIDRDADSFWHRSPDGELTVVAWVGQVVTDRTIPAELQSLSQLVVDDHGRVLIRATAEPPDRIERNILLGYEPQRGVETLLMQDDPFDPAGEYTVLDLWMAAASGHDFPPRPLPLPAILLRLVDQAGDLHTGIYQIRWPACAADLTASTSPADPTYGLPDGIVSSSDFFYFLDGFAAGNAGIADLTGSTDPNDPGYGVPDGIVDVLDFFYFIELFVAGCP